MSKQVHAVGIMFENELGEILVLRRNKTRPEGETWGLVGGKIDLGETKEQAIVREVREEIGHQLDLSQMKYLKQYHWDREDLDITFDVFKVVTVKSAITPDLQIHEATEYSWSKPSDLYRQSDLMVGLYPILKDEYLI